MVENVLVTFSGMLFDLYLVWKIRFSLQYENLIHLISSWFFFVCYSILLVSKNKWDIHLIFLGVIIKSHCRYFLIDGNHAHKKTVYSPYVPRGLSRPWDGAQWQRVRKGRRGLSVTFIIIKYHWATWDHWPEAPGSYGQKVKILLYLWFHISSITAVRQMNYFSIEKFLTCYIFYSSFIEM